MTECPLETPPASASARAEPLAASTLAVCPVARPVAVATLAGLAAIAIWSWFAVLISWTGPVPPFQLNAMGFAIAAMVTVAGSAIARQRGSPASRSVRTAPAAWLVCVGGLFGNHALTFAALKNAPPAVAALLNYLGPVGTACRLWDVGIRGGDIRLLGVASNATPVLSTLLLVLFGFAAASPSLLVACVLIAAGAAVAQLAPPPVTKERLPCVS